MIKRNNNGDFVISKGFLTFLSVLIPVIFLLFNFFTYSVGRAVEFASYKERVRYLEMKISETSKAIEELKEDIKQIRKDIEQIREDIVLIKTKINVINKNRR